MKSFVGKIRRRLKSDKRPTNFASLHQDVLYPIAETLEFDSLRCFSSTSRRIRSICLPILFRHYSIAGRHFNRPCPPPPHLSQFIQIFSYRKGRDREMIEDFFVSIAELPSVHTVRIHDVGSGVPMQHLGHYEDVSLRSLEITETQLKNLDANTPKFVVLKPMLSSLSRFVYSINHWLVFILSVADKRGRKRGNSLSLPSQGLCELLEPMRESLRSLEISSHYGLFSWMSSVHWPRIRELCLDGMYIDKHDLRAVRSLVSSLPDLQVLSLKLARTVDAEEPMLLMPSSATDKATDITLSCLERFTIAFPIPVDGIFGVLPVSLRHLSLRDWPRYYFLQDPDEEDGPRDLGLAMPIVTSSECLEILQRCHCPHLRSLEVVYRADWEEDALFGHIVASFPLLTKFELHRYRAYTDEDVPMEHIAGMLSRLDDLCSLRLNLDLPTHQLPPHELLAYTAIDAVKDDMMYRAVQCAEIIGPNLVEVAFILRVYAKNKWVVWRIQHAEGGAVSAVKGKKICDAARRCDISVPTPYMGHGREVY